MADHLGVTPLAAAAAPMFMSRIRLTFPWWEGLRLPRHASTAALGRHVPRGRSCAREGSRLRHVGRSGDGEAQGRTRRDDLFFLLRRLPGKVRRRARALPHEAAGAPGGCGHAHHGRARLRRMAAPTAIPRPRRRRRPRARSTPARCIPRSARTIREPARSAAWRSSASRNGGGRSERGTRRHDAAVLDRARALDSRRSRLKWADISSIRTALRLKASSNWMQLALATPVALWAGWPFLQRGWASLTHRAISTCSR